MLLLCALRCVCVACGFALHRVVCVVVWFGLVWLVCVCVVSVDLCLFLFCVSWYGIVCYGLCCCVLVVVLVCCVV